MFSSCDYHSSVRLWPHFTKFFIEVKVKSRQKVFLYLVRKFGPFWRFQTIFWSFQNFFFWQHWISVRRICSVARFGPLGPNWSFQTSFGPQKLHLVLGPFLVRSAHSVWSFGPFWSFMRTLFWFGLLRNFKFFWLFWGWFGQILTYWFVIYLGNSRRVRKSK